MTFRDGGASYGEGGGRDGGGEGRGRDGGGRGGKRRGGGRRRRVCRFCADKSLKIDYKDPYSLRYFITDRGRIVPRRISGTCAKHQRRVSLALKRARNVALMPFTVSGR
ncbi:MAG: 30S ribosomal protein S18 [Deltaproteobacteria bacterium]|nr:30S ribosomal protein S18 [Deltaproteobacteria bacterium]